MAAKDNKAPALKAEAKKANDDPNVVTINGLRMRKNESGRIVLVCTKHHLNKFPGDVFGVEPPAARKLIEDRVAELHAISLVDPPKGDGSDEDGDDKEED